MLLTLLNSNLDPQGRAGQPSTSKFVRGLGMIPIKHAMHSQIANVRMPKIGQRDAQKLGGIAHVHLRR